ncbi:MAG: GxxExxY protein [Longimicrobiales bacterium]
MVEISLLGSERARAGNRPSYSTLEINGYRGDKLTGRVIQCIIHVHQTLGPGFLASMYRRAQVGSYLRGTHLDLA